ncbi:unnamed protein product [Arctia plantaginis]|uniref:Uncharacterized protein n=1 Tax=Arctia plantaginis TaxID=874455 RepID=A0A8S1BIC6_ARCPL|nr:unnamed protein product [Arctia plantaginis]
MAQKQRACDIIGQALRNSQQIKLQKIRRKINFDVQPDEDINSTQLRSNHHESWKAFHHNLNYATAVQSS